MSDFRETAAARSDGTENSQHAGDAFDRRPDPSTAQIRDAQQTVTPPQPFGVDSFSPTQSSAVGIESIDSSAGNRPFGSTLGLLHPKPGTGGPAGGGDNPPPRKAESGSRHADQVMAPMKAKDAEVEQMLRKHRG